MTRALNLEKSVKAPPLLPKKSAGKKAAAKNTIEVLLGEENLGALEHEHDIPLDLETSGLSPYKDKVAVVSLFSPKTKTAVIIHNKGKWSKRLKAFIESRKEIITHNGAGFDILCLHSAGLDVFKPKWHDTMLAELALLSTDRRDVSVNLKSTLKRRTGTKISKDVDHSGWMNDNLTESQVNYCVEDISKLADLKYAQIERADEDQLNAIGVENDLIPVIVKMVTNGVPIDVPRLNAFIKNQKKVIDKLKGSLAQDFGGPINLNSPVQIKKAMAAKGWEMPSTNQETMEDQIRFGGECGRICANILEVRHALQRVKMYTPEWVGKYVIDGRVHPKLWTCSTDTGRMSSSDPNAQQIPRDMRSVFGGIPGYKIVKCDASQIEVRVAASVANCPGLRAAFEAGLHIHTDIGSKAFGIPYEEIVKQSENGDDTWKNLAKGLTFTMLFGGGWETFQISARRAGVELSEKECLKIFDDFFRSYPGMANLKKRAQVWAQRAKAGKPIVLRLPTGLKRVLFGWKAKPSRIMNTLIQGGAAAGMKFGMLEAYRRGLGDYLILSVHDELVACVPDKQAKDYARELMESMNVGYETIMDVPSVCKFSIGDYWS